MIDFKVFHGEGRGLMLSHNMDFTPQNDIKHITAVHFDGELRFYMIVRYKTKETIYFNIATPSTTLDNYDIFVLVIQQLKDLFGSSTIITEFKKWSRSDKNTINLHKALLKNNFTFEGVLRSFNNNRKSVRYIYG